MKRTYGKVAAVLLIIALLFTSVNLDALLVAAEGETVPEWDYELALEPDMDLSGLSEAFSAYKYAWTAGSGELTAEAQAPAEVFVANSSFGNANQGYLRPKERTTYSVLTYTQKGYADLYVEMEYFSSYSRFGLVIGGEPGTFPISRDSNNTNDTGVFIYANSDGQITAAGAVKPETAELTGSEAAVDSNNGDVSGTAHVRGLNGALTVNKVYSGVLTAENDQYNTLCVKITGRTLEVWEKKDESKKLTVELADSYQGGYVSLATDEYQHGAYRGLRISGTEWTEAEVWDYELALEPDMDLSSLSEAFSAYKYAWTAGSGELTAEAQAPAEVFVASTSSGNQNKGYLRPKESGNGVYSVLTYTPKSYGDLYVEMEYFSSWNRFGLVIGGEPGTFPISRDSNNTNDTGVFIYANSSGQITAAGAVKPETAVLTGGVNVDSNNGDVSGTAHVRGLDRALTVNDVPQNNIVLTADNDQYNTLCVKITGRTLEIWEKKDESRKLTVELADSYQGGYVSLAADQKDHGAYRGLRISGTEWTEPELWDYELALEPDMDLSGLSDVFSAYKYAWTAGSGELTAEAQAPAEVFVASTSSGNQNKGYLRPKESGNGVYSVLTYTPKSYGDLYVEMEYFSSWNRFGLVIGGEPGTFPISRDSNNTNDTGVFIYANSSGQITAAGAVKPETAVLTGGVNVDSNNGDVSGTAHVRGLDRALTVNDVPQNNIVLTADNDQYNTLCVKITGRTLEIWEKKDESRKLTVELADSYQGGYVSLAADQKDHGAFRGLRIREAWDYKLALEPDMDLSGLSDVFSAYKYAWTAGSGELTAEAQAPAEVFVASTSSGNQNKGYLRPKESGNGVYSVLTYTPKNYGDLYVEMEYFSSWNRFGLVIGGEPGTFPISRDSNNTNDTGVFIYANSSGQITAAGAVKPETAVLTGGVNVDSNNGDVSGTAHVRGLDRALTVNDVPQNNIVLTADNDQYNTLCVKITGRTLEVWEKKDESRKLTVELADSYQGGYVSLAADQKDHGAFRGLRIRGTEWTEPVDPPTDPMDEVAEQFDAYYLADASVTNVMESVDVKEHWGINGQGFISAAKDSTGNETRNVDVLTWKEQPYTDFEMTFTYQQTWHRVGVLLGTEKGVFPLSKSGDITIAEGGIMFFLEAEGTPNAMGDFVNGYTNAKNVHRRITGLNLANFTDESGNATSHVNNKTEHTLKIVVKGKDLYAYVDSYTEPIMYLALPDDYEGGYVSLFSASNPGYGVKDFTISEEITTALPEKETGDNVYAVDFTELHGIKELAEDFSAYALDSIEEEPREIPVEEAFTIVGNGIRRNTESQGNDWGGFHILTLNKKRYENFELELVYAQSWIRFGVMVGELGEFAYSGTEGDSRGTYGAALAYTEAEGHRNIKGGMTAGSTTVHSYALAKDETRISGFDNLGSVEKNVNGEVLHTMKLRVVGDYLTMVIDGNEDSRMTVCLDGYDGGYISLVTNGSATAKGAFRSLKITELGADAVLGTEAPEQKGGFTSLEKMEEEFDAYYLADAAVSTTMEPVDLVENWWFNAQGYAARYEAGHGSEYEDVDVLTYTKQTYTDFELTYTYQQTYNRTGIIFGTQAGQFPLQATDQGLKATGGVMFFMEAEGNPNAMGDFVSGYTNQRESRQRLDPVEMEGFVDAEGSAMDNVNNKASHQVKIVVKNREMYVFVDGSSEYCMYLKLPESYNGGYISIFSSAPKTFGIDNFTISETITTALPAKTGVTSDGTSMSVAFDDQNFDAGAFDTYYLEQINETGALARTDFYDHWMIANGSLKRQSNSVGGSDVSDVAVLTYKERTYEDFVATIEYQKTPGRLMFFFGTENGSYPLYRDSAGDQENGGVILYPENDMGAGGGICAVGEVKLANAGYRPIYHVKPYAPGYHDQEEWLSNVGNTYTLTVAVINKHCYVYLEGFGLMTDFDLMDDYDGGYLSLASSSTAQHGFKSFSVTAIDGASGSVIADADALRDITVKTGTPLEGLELPSTVRVTTGNGQRFDADVTWSAQGYDGSTPGNYQFAGTLSVPGLSNPGRVAALLTVRVRDSWQSSSGSTKIWTFDTESDLLDFESYYVKDANEGGAVRSDFPMWYVQDGQLWMDRNRGSNGSENSNVHILTYTGKQYKNFEAQVDFSQQYVRQMILFGSKEPGQYIDYADPQADTNPIAAYVEFEGNRNAIGNVVNTNYYRRLDEQVPMLREDAAVDDQFYDKEDPQSSMGTMHTLKIRVVGDEISMWLDDYEEVFTGKLGEGYEGGYISLVSAAREVALDNFRITELDEDGNPVEENLTVAANGTLNLTLGEDAPQQEEEEEPIKPVEDEKEEEPKKELPVAGIVAGVCAAVVVTAGIVTAVILRKRRKHKEKPEETDRKEGN